MALPTNQSATCYTSNQSEVCDKAAGITCGYTSGSDSACARASGTPAATYCDCSSGGDAILAEDGEDLLAEDGELILAE